MMRTPSWVACVAPSGLAPAACRDPRLFWSRLAGVCAVVTLALSSVVIGSRLCEGAWPDSGLKWLHDILQGAPVKGMTRMALLTALSFWMLAASLLGFVARPECLATRRFAQAAAGAVILWGLYVLAAFLLGNPWWLPTDSALPGPVDATAMSEFTAAIFVAVGVVVLGVLAETPLSLRLASVGVCVLGAVNLLILLANAYQFDLFKATFLLNVAVAPLTAAAFLVLALSLIAALGPNRFPLRPFLGPSPRARMLRSFLPVVIGIQVGYLLLDAWVRGAVLINTEAALKERLLLNSAALCLAGIVVTTLVICSMSAHIGAAIDRAEALRDDALNQMLATIGELQLTHEQLEQTNAELATARDKAEQVSVAKDYFLATVSHELRTPLNHVIGFIQLLELTELDEDQRRDLDKIGRAAHNLMGLVNDLLDFQKIVQGALTLEPATFDLAPWLEELVEPMRTAVEARGNRLVVECPADIGSLHADEKRLRQSLTNLLTNATKFTQAGEVRLTLWREGDVDGDFLYLDVSDTGRGMTLAQQAKLFQPFTKLLSRSDNPEGTGLGLALSQKLCRLMGGDLTLSQSEPGRGSTFTIRLPAKSVEGPKSARPVLPAPAAADEGTRKVATVLVIDDDPEVRELMRRHLDGQGFVVHLAASGTEGLEMVKRLRPDAITLDVLMPGIDGWGTLAALQADAETAHIPVIMITMLDDSTRGFAMGAWECLPKPISWSRLIDLFRHIEPNSGPVLLIDDDPVMREVAGRTLRQHGWDVRCAENGRVGLEAAARRLPVLVLLDLLMPEMDGFEFLDAFRKEPAWREVPVVVLTAKELTGDERRRLDGLAQRVLSRGACSQEELFREVEWLLNNHGKTAHPGDGVADQECAV